jgi:O-acetyl-ADP-ribose deacetylase (regulator of RNase III)
MAETIANNYNDPVTISDAYDVLKLKYGESDAAVRTAFRRLALQYHPDKARSIYDSRRFYQIKAASQLILGELDTRELDYMAEEAEFYKYDYANDESFNQSDIESNEITELEMWNMPDEDDMFVKNDELDDLGFTTAHSDKNMTAQTIELNSQTSLISPIDDTLVINSADGFRILPILAPNILNSAQIVAARANRRPNYYCGNDYVSIEDIITDDEIAAHAPPYIAVQKGLITNIEVDCIVSSITNTFEELYDVGKAVGTAVGNDIITKQLAAYRDAETVVGASEIRTSPATCVLTESGDLPAHYVIHVVVNDQMPSTAVMYYNALTMAAAQGFRTIAFCAFNTHKYEDQHIYAATIRMTINKWLSQNSNAMDAILILTYTDQEFRLLNASLRGLYGCI